MEIIYKSGFLPTIEQVIEFFEKSGMPRPITDYARMNKMFENSDFIITAWDQDKLVGVSRGITDWVWCCYLSDLAVFPDYKKKGVGKKLIQQTREIVGEQSMIVLLSVPAAMEYYPKVGFTKDDRCFIINRSK